MPNLALVAYLGYNAGLIPQAWRATHRAYRLRVMLCRTMVRNPRPEIDSGDTPLEMRENGLGGPK